MASNILRANNTKYKNFNKSIYFIEPNTQWYFTHKSFLCHRSKYFHMVFHMIFHLMKYYQNENLQS